MINRELYITLVNQHLQDINYYKALEYSLLNQTTKKINALLHNLHKTNSITTKTYNKLKPNNNSKPGTFYGIPKLHKPKLTIRPIISNINHPTTNISKHLHTIMQPLVATSKSYIRNSQHLLQLLEKHKPTQHTVIITADIESLYTNIPNQLGIENVIAELGKYNPKYNNPKVCITIRTLLHNTLTNNIFTFNQQHFIQIKGTAMGTTMAPAYANLVLKHMEDERLIYNDHMREKYKNNLQFFKRYIDDVIIIYENHNNTLESFIHDLETLYEPLKLNITHGTTQNFLDLTITVDPLINRLNTTLYKKPLANTQLLNPKSNHPQHIIKNSLTQELIRISRNCNNPTDQEINKNKLLNQALQQRYTIKQFNSALKHKTKTANNTIEKRKKNKKVKLTFSTKAKRIAKLTKKLFPKAYIIYRTLPNLKQILIRSQLTTTNKQRIQAKNVTS